MFFKKKQQIDRAINVNENLGCFCHKQNCH